LSDISRLSDVEVRQMAFREVSVVEVREVLRAWLAGTGLRTVAQRAGVDRKTARRYVAAAEAAGLVRTDGEAQLTDELIGQVVDAVRPARPGGHGSSWEALEAEHAHIAEWVKQDLSVVKIGDLLARRGVLVPYRTVHRFCVERAGFRSGAGTTVRVADGEPGVECQIDFARMGLIYDPGSGRRRVTHALIFTAVYSRHMFVWLTFSGDPGRAHRRCRVGVAVLRRGIPGVGAGQCLGDRRRRRLGQPQVHRRLAGLRPALRVRHRRGPGPLAEGQTQGRAECPICTGEFLRR
jgi:hypothetical protein